MKMMILIIVVNFTVQVDFLELVSILFPILKTSNPVIVLEDDEKLILTPDQSLSDCGIGE